MEFLVLNRAAAYSYISDVAKEETRTLQIGMLDLMYFLGGAIGGGLGGFLLTEFGSITVYIVAICLFSVSILYGVLILKETKVIVY